MEDEAGAYWQLRADELLRVQDVKECELGGCLQFIRVSGGLTCERECKRDRRRG